VRTGLRSWFPLVTLISYASHDTSLFFWKE
jgi:hypothetical protein